MPARAKRHNISEISVHQLLGLHGRGTEIIKQRIFGHTNWAISFPSEFLNKAGFLSSH